MRNYLLCIVVFLLAGCQPMAVQTHAEGPVPVTLRVDDAAYWLEEWQRMMTLPPDQVAQAVVTREQEFSDHPGPRTRLRLVLLLAEGPPAVRDERRALKLLKDMDTAHASPSTQALAALLGQTIRDQVVAGDKISELRQELNTSNERVKELERQLQELTDIEQSIQQRETPVERKEME